MNFQLCKKWRVTVTDIEVKPLLGGDIPCLWRQGFCDASWPVVCRGAVGCACSSLCHGHSGHVHGQQHHGGHPLWVRIESLLIQHPHDCHPQDERDVKRCAERLRETAHHLPCFQVPGKSVSGNLNDLDSHLCCKGRLNSWLEFKYHRSLLTVTFYVHFMFLPSSDDAFPT